MYEGGPDLVRIRSTNKRFCERLDATQFSERAIRCRTACFRPGMLRPPRWQSAPSPSDISCVLPSGNVSPKRACSCTAAVMAPILNMRFVCCFGYASRGTRSNQPAPQLAGAREISAHRVIAAGNGNRAGNLLGIRADSGNATAIRQEPRCGSISGISACTRRFRRQSAAIRHQLRS